LGHSQPVTSLEAFPTLIAWGLPGVPLLGLGWWCWGGAGGLGTDAGVNLWGEKPWENVSYYGLEMFQMRFGQYFLPRTLQVCTKSGLWGRVVHCPRSPKAVSSAGLSGR